MEVTLVGNFIFYVKGLMSPKLCQSILKTYEKDSRKRPGHTVSSYGNNKLRDDVKICTDLDIKKDGSWKTPHDELHLAVSQVVLGIAAQTPILQVWPLKWSGYKIQHYKKNEGLFKWHCDAMGPGAWDRQLAMVIYLNTVDEGGETCFLHQNLKVKPVAGDALFFPTFWTHLHCGEIPRSHDKYIISSFVSFDIPASEGKKTA